MPISSNIFSKADGSHTWDMIVSGIFTAADQQTDTNYLLFHYDYFIETQTFGDNWIGWLVLTTDDPSINERVAKAIDKQFANSSAETETSTEKAFNKAFIEQIGSIGLIITSVILAAFFTILFIVGNSMALAVRERTREIAVLKTLGFTAQRVFRLVIIESLTLASLGGLLGLILAAITLEILVKVPQIRSILPNLVMTDDIVIQALLYMIALGVVTGLVPALRAMKLNITEALARG